MQGCVGLNRDKYGASAMVVDLSRGLPHAALARITQSLASDLRAQVLCFNLKEFQIVFLRSRALRNTSRSS